MKRTVLGSVQDSALRKLDSAPAAEPIDRDRQGTLLATVLAGVPDTAGTTVPQRRRPVHRLILAGAVAVTVAVAGVAIVPGRGDGYAYASWTPRPEPVAAADLALVHAACLDETPDPTVGVGGPDRFDPKDLSVRLAERRGTWVGLLLTGRTGNSEWEVSCLAELPAGTTDVDHVSAGVSSGGGLNPPGGDEFIDGGVAVFGLDRGLFGSGRRQSASVTSGQVGPDVVGVTIHAGGTTAEASVEDGTYAVWWPGTAFDTTQSPSSGKSRPQLAITYDLTLQDGTVLRNARPTYR